MTGRNDPCPCGSGRKYKACCWSADRKAQGLGGPHLRFTPEVLERVRREDVWQAELVPFAAAFDDEPGARPVIAVVMAGQRPVWVDILRRASGEPADVANLLADAVLAAAERIGGTPSRVDVRHREVVAGLRHRLESRRVDVAVTRSLLELDAFAGEMVGHLEGRLPEDAAPFRPCASSAETWAAWMLPEGAVADLFSAAAAYCRARPWEGVDDTAPVDVEWEGRCWSVSVLGSGGIERGLSIFSDTDDRELVLDPFGGAETLGSFSGRSLAMTFNRPEELPERMRREVMDAGWPVEAPDAYPTLLTVNTPGGGVSEADLRDLVVALRAVASGASELASGWAADRDAEWHDLETGAVVRLGAQGLSWPPSDPATDEAVRRRLDAILPILAAGAYRERLPADLVEFATVLLNAYAIADPNVFLAGYKLEILAAASLHSAGLLLETAWGGWRPTLEELAAMWDVSTASISKRSREIRECVTELAARTRG